jgi:hypothetical protein
MFQLICDNCGKNLKSSGIDWDSKPLKDWVKVDAILGDFGKFLACSQECAESLRRKEYHVKCGNFVADACTCEGDISRCDNCEKVFCEAHLDVGYAEDGQSMCCVCACAERDAEEKEEVENRRDAQKNTLEFFDRYKAGLKRIASGFYGDLPAQILVTMISEGIPIYINDCDEPIVVEKADVVDFEAKASEDDLPKDEHGVPYNFLDWFTFRSE